MNYKVFLKGRNPEDMNGIIDLMLLLKTTFEGLTVQTPKSLEDEK